MRQLSIWISRRLRPGGGGAGSPAAVVIAVAGVALALMVMEFTLAVVVGFKDGIRSKLMGFDAEISVEAPLTAARESSSLELTPALDSIVRNSLPGSAELRLSLRQPGMLKTDDNFQGLVYVGQSPDAAFTFEKSNIVAGEWPDFSADSCVNSIVISRAVAEALNLEVGSRVFSTFIVDGAIKLRRHKIAGLYTSNFGEYDNTIVYASLKGLQQVCGIDSAGGSRLDIRGIPADLIESTGADVQHALVSATARGELADYYPVDTIKRSGALYFNWLALLDTNVAVIFILMLAVAGFTLVSSLFILILERLPMIGLLRALGGSRSLVRDIFVDMGLRLVGSGMLVGNIAGIGLLLLQKYTHVVKLDPAMYYLSEVPVEIVPWAFVALNVGVALVSWLILLVPARLASGADPAKIIGSD